MLKIFGGCSFVILQVRSVNICCICISVYTATDIIFLNLGQECIKFMCEKILNAVHHQTY